MGVGSSEVKVDEVESALERVASNNAEWWLADVNALSEAAVSSVDVSDVISSDAMGILLELSIMTEKDRSDKLKCWPVRPADTLSNCWSID